MLLSSIFLYCYRKWKTLLPGAFITGHKDNSLFTLADLWWSSAAIYGVCFRPLWCPRKLFVITATLTAISCSNLSTFISMKFDGAANLLCVCVRCACVQLDPIWSHHHKSRLQTNPMRGFSVIMPEEGMLQTDPKRLHGSGLTRESSRFVPSGVCWGKSWSSHLPNWCLLRRESNYGMLDKTKTGLISHELFIECFNCMYCLEWLFISECVMWKWKHAGCFGDHV